MHGESGAIVPGIHFAAQLDDADAILRAVTAEIEVSTELIAAGSGNGAVATPRLTGWYGDPHASYTYSGITRTPKPWTPALAALRDRLNATLAIALNSCLVGVYEDGTNHVDWHADDEPELRDRIVSVSLGAARTFVLRESGIPANDRCARTEPVAIPLAHGSVLVMSVDSQRLWQHAIPEQPGAARRINLTYRVIAN
jgi:alkylated DNA repair dioxygenase AlkB